MNSVPVWIINTYTNIQDANNAKNALVFSPTVQSALKTTRDDMLNAGTALIKVLSSQLTTTDADRKSIEQQMRAVETKMSKLDTQSRELGMISYGNNATTTNINTNVSATTMESFTPTIKLLRSSLSAQEEDTRIQFKSNYTFYTVWFVIAVLLIIVMFSNFFYKSSNTDLGNDNEESSSSSSSSSSYALGFGIIAMLFFIYFIIQFVLAHFNISRPQLPFESINPLFVFKK
jgi:hypothetical protein